MTTVTDIFVTSSGSSNDTNTIRGERASSTCSPEVAATRLAEKLFGPALIRVTKGPNKDQFTSFWKAEADAESWASCDSVGNVHIAAVIPPLNTGLAHGPHRALLMAIATLLEPLGRGHDHKRLVVPGVGEAASREEKDLAIAAWLRKQSVRNNKRGSLSVLFATTVVRAQL